MANQGQKGRFTSWSKAMDPQEIRIVYTKPPKNSFQSCMGCVGWCIVALLIAAVLL